MRLLRRPLIIFLLVILLCWLACWQLNHIIAGYEARIAFLQTQLATAPPWHLTVDVTVHHETELTTIGFRNNNPGNVKGTNWLGQTGNDEHGHAVFQRPEYGLRAIAVTLIRYQEKHDLRTIRQIVNRYCRKNRGRYARYLATELNVGVDEVIDVRKHLPTLMKSIVLFENGIQPYPDHVFALAAVDVKY